MPQRLVLVLRAFSPWGLFFPTLRKVERLRRPVVWLMVCVLLLLVAGWLSGTVFKSTVRGEVIPQWIDL